MMILYVSSLMCPGRDLTRITARAEDDDGLDVVVPGALTITRVSARAGRHGAAGFKGKHKQTNLG